MYCAQDITQLSSRRWDFSVYDKLGKIGFKNYHLYSAKKVTAMGSNPSQLI